MATKRVRFAHDMEYQGVIYDGGGDNASVAEFDEAEADLLIASGYAVETTEVLRPSDDAYLRWSAVGTPSGVAPLDVDEHVPAENLPVGVGPSQVAAGDHVHAASDHSHTGYVPTGRRISTGTGMTGGGDLTANRTLSVVADTTVQRIEIARAGALVGSRRRLNLIPGPGVDIQVADIAASNRLDVTISTTGGGSGGGSVSPLNTQAETYILTADDVGRTVEMASGLATSVIIPADDGADIPIGAVVTVQQYGTGPVSLVAASGDMTLRSRGALLRLAGRYAVATLYKRAANDWLISGDLGA